MYNRCVLYFKLDMGCKCLIYKSKKYKVFDLKKVVFFCLNLYLNIEFYKVYYFICVLFFI